MSIKSIQKNNIVNSVFEQMNEHIRSGYWEVGSKIPSEIQLCEMFQVSRVSVRSAIQKLRDMGIVTTHQGRGTFVAEVPNEFTFFDSGPIMRLSEKQFLDMMDFRLTVELKCLELAAQHASDEDFQSLENILNTMINNKNNYKKYTEADFEFHLAIAKASKNDVFYSVTKGIKELYYFYLEELNRVFGVTLESIEVHINIFRALQNRNSDAAQEIIKESMKENVVKMKQHLSSNK
ncbi:FadR family transcriptional regulator [Paenibacillus terrae]|uniref:FadR family transcriptional regulator n=1 Tax=Paenibacillus terrae TaxID=159743 RepID=A0A4U2Q190_9BACL|nr:FadR/GntR family transcriptional regulator [Paenibacillus terrae]TKH45962.1 FadR family transcriptional regulator [Paenibacillus terrae]